MMSNVYTGDAQRERFKKTQQALAKNKKARKTQADPNSGGVIPATPQPKRAASEKVPK